MTEHGHDCKLGVKLVYQVGKHYKQLNGKLGFIN